MFSLKSFAGSFSLTALVALMAVGCGSSGDSEDDTSGTEDKFTAGANANAPNDADDAASLKAELKVVPFTKTVGKCKIDVKQLEVKLADTAAAALINRELKKTDQYNTYLDPTDCADNAMEVEGGSTGAFNERGWLSVTVAESSYYEGAAHPSHSYNVKNFDLKTGKLVQLPAVVDAEGLKIIAAKCTTIMNESEEASPEDDYLGDACKGAVETHESDSPVYAIEAGGLRIHPIGLPHAAFALAAEGALIPWAALKNHTSNPVVKKISGQ